MHQSLHTLLPVASAAVGLALASPVDNVVKRETTGAAPSCTTGLPVTTSGYSINYAQATPTIAFNIGYRPEPAWASAHYMSDMSYGGSEPDDEVFAYLQFKCQYHANSADAASFFVQYDPAKGGTTCNMYDDLLDPVGFVANNQTHVGAWNSICNVTHPGTTS
ncbi:hypothetical protein F4778DRAFT_775499 [Xylariomycetidae sp. FL2044]|nr:hypothetical protein F4778DRAFT_775499 [Xylariomycetidae sp. FL2044]